MNTFGDKVAVFTKSLVHIGIMTFTKITQGSRVDRFYKIKVSTPWNNMENLDFLAIFVVSGKSEFS